ncbi:MAG: SDR family oxidoreductase [Syntrophaceae bacterium]
MRNVCITGASGYIGSKIARFLAQKEEIGHIVGLDIHPPKQPIPRFSFYKRDVREPIDDILKEHAIDTMIHTAYVLPPIHDKNRMEAINVGGTRNVMTACARHCVEHVLYTSSSTAYGFHPDNDNPLTEASSLRGNADFTYCKNKREIELAIPLWLKDNQTMRLTILRPCFVVGPGFDNPLARYLQKKIVVLPRRTEPLQLVHEDDLVRIIYLALRDKKTGVYNVGGDGTVPFAEMVNKLGGILLPLPDPVLTFFNAIAWNLHLWFLSEFPNPAMNMVRYPWVVSSDKLKRDLGFSYQYTSRTAFDDFASIVRKGKSR